MASHVVRDSPVSAWLFSNTKSGWIWLLVRLYVGYVWLMAGWEKVISDMWTGSRAGSVVTKFAMGSLTKTAGAHPDVPTGEWGGEWGQGEWGQPPFPSIFVDR